MPDLSSLLDNAEEIKTLSDKSQKIRKPHSHAIVVRKALASDTGSIRLGPLSRVENTGTNGLSEIDQFVQKVRSAHTSANRIEHGAGRPGFGIEVQKTGNPTEDHGFVEVRVWHLDEGTPDVAAENLNDDSAYDQNDPAEVPSEGASRARRSRRSE
jgi:hypothetical protein